MNPAQLLESIKTYGIHTPQEVIYNPSYDLLFKEETNNERTGYDVGVETKLGAVAVNTGVFTGRSPKDKYFVRDDVTRDTLWWSDQGTNDNKPLNQQQWSALKLTVGNQLSHKKLFVIDLYCGADEESRLKVRFVTEVAWQAHFVKNMFIRPNEEELKNFTPDFVVLNGAKATQKNWQQLGLHSENFVAFNMTEGIQLIGGTWYGGEMKKGLFSL